MMKWIKLCFITALGAVPTVTRNCLANHNPIFPLAISLLGPAQTKIFADYVGYGVRLTPIELLKLPWTLLITSEFAKPIFDYTLGKVFLVQLLGLPFLIILNRKEKGAVLSLKRNSEMLFLIIFVALDFLIWIVTSQQLRFLVPAILIVQIFLLLRLLMMPLNKASFGTITFLTVAGVISNAAIHRNDLKENFLTPFNLAKPCMESADRNHLGPIAQLQRESSLGYFDNEFVFVGSHPYSVVSDQSRAEWPKYLFFTGVPREASTWGYYPVPAGDKISENCSFLYVNSNPALIPPIPSETVGK